MGAHNVAVQHGDAAAVLGEQDGEDFGDGGFTGTGQAGEPDANALPAAGREGLGQNGSRLGASEPGGQELAFGEIVVPNLMGGDGQRALTLGNSSGLFVAIVVRQIYEII